jgi:hypothetical protein
MRIVIYEVFYEIAATIIYSPIKFVVDIIHGDQKRV